MCFANPINIIVVVYLQHLGILLICHILESTLHTVSGYLSLMSHYIIMLGPIISSHQDRDCGIS